MKSKVIRTLVALALALGLAVGLSLSAAAPAQAASGGVVINVSYSTGWHQTFTLQYGTVITSLRVGDTSRTYGIDARSYRLPSGTCARTSTNGGPIVIRQAGTWYIQDWESVRVDRYPTSSTRC